MKTIDLRSDTVTRPSDKMRAAMAHAEVGDDVYGDDPTVNRLQELAADMLDMEDAVFVPSGTQSNLIALMAHCERGDEYIVGQKAHTYLYEGGGAAIFGSIQPQPLDFENNGTLDLAKVATAIKPDDSHFAKTRLLSLENTQNGKPLPMNYLADARTFVNKHGLGIHLDGARLFNAAVAHQVPVREIARHFDSVSVCLSKGLGAPVGSVLCGKKSLIDKARRWRKPLGGGMRQAGLLAAAGIMALEENVDRLADDHRRARQLAESLSQLKGLEVTEQNTNMLFVKISEEKLSAISESMAEQKILVSLGPVTRLVTHLDIDDSNLETVVDAFKKGLQ